MSGAQRRRYKARRRMAHRVVHEFPVVADIDNDGSAEFLVVSSSYGGVESEWSIRAIRDVEDRWVSARRIWNQHTYHVTNVREDGRIPQYEPPNWNSLMLTSEEFAMNH